MPSCAPGAVSRSWPSESSQRVLGPAGPVGSGANVRSRPPSSRARPSKLSRRRSHRSRVASRACERPGQVLRQQPRERRQVGRLEDPLGETARGAARLEVKRKAGMRAPRLTAEKNRRYDTGTEKEAARRRAARPPAGQAFPTRRSAPPESWSWRGPAREAPPGFSRPARGPARPRDRTREKRSNDRGREPHQEVRPHDGGGRGLVPRRAGRDPRLPGPERGREDDDHADPHLLPAPHRGHGAGGRLRRLRAADGGQAAGRLPAGDAAPLPRHERPRVPGLLRADQGRSREGAARPASRTRSRSAASATCGTS